MTTTFDDSSVQWAPLERIEPVAGASPYELEVAPLRIDERRPWPLGLPAEREALEAIADREHLALELKKPHLEVLRLLPEQLLDAARAALAGTEAPLAAVAASTWRAMVAAAGAELALGVDQPALRALIDEAAAAREKLVALGYFSLDGGAHAEPLLHALGEAIELLVRRARFQAKPKVRGTKTSASGKLVPVRSTSRALKVVFAAVMLTGAAFHFSGFLENERARAAWVVVGDVDRGRAFLAPAGDSPSEASLQRLIVELKTQGIGATKSSSGEWVLQRSGKGSP